MLENMDKNAPDISFTSRGRLRHLPRPAVMGILNVTSDSFYDGGRHNTPDAMVAHARRLLADGADIIDVGAASSRPGAVLPPPEEEAARLHDAIALLRRELGDEVVISADTCFAMPARAAIEAGADIINDIGGGDTDEHMFDTVAGMQVPYILMHGAMEHFGRRKAEEDDIVDRVVRYVSERLDRLYRLGVKDVWIDPGFGFGKTLAENHALLRRLDELTSLFREPLVAALSRKRMVYEPLGLMAQEALAGTVALDAIALDRGAAIVRVHDVKEAVQTAKLLTSLTE